MNNFVKRTLSGALFVAIIISSILLNKYLFAIVFALISGLTILEFHKLINNWKEISINKWLLFVGSILLFSISFLNASGFVKAVSFGFYGLFMILVFVSEIYRKKENPLHNLAYFLLSQVYVVLPFSLLNYILFVNNYQPVLLLAVFVTIWVNDTGAYLFGVTFGKHRLLERISPKKSWEGFFGGAFATLISGYVFSLIIPDISLINWLIFSEIVLVFGTFGDLLESLIKRTVQVKDSGTIIPGHGGLLDRFDSMILAAPVIYIFLSFLFK